MVTLSLLSTVIITIQNTVTPYKYNLTPFHRTSSSTAKVWREQKYICILRAGKTTPLAFSTLRATNGSDAPDSRHVFSERDAKPPSVRSLLTSLHVESSLVAEQNTDLSVSSRPAMGKKKTPVPCGLQAERAGRD
jgi:hypothetical protein